jgi:hypothetical protein
LQAFDALPTIAGPGGALFDLADTTTLGDVRNGWLRGGWARDGLWDAEATPVDAMRKHFGAFFRQQYARTSKREIVKAPR